MQNNLKSLHELLSGIIMRIILVFELTFNCILKTRLQIQRAFLIEDSVICNVDSNGAGTNGP